MNNKQALQIIAQIVVMAPVPLSTHQQVAKALEVISAALAEKEKTSD